MKLSILLEGDSDNTYFEDKYLTLDEQFKLVKISLKNPDREILVSTEDLKKAMSILGD